MCCHSSSRGSSQPKDWTRVSCVGRWVLHQWANWEAVRCLESESRSVVSDSLGLHGLYSSWNSPGQNTGVDSLSLLQGIFPTQRLNLGLPLWADLYQLSHKGSPRILEWVKWSESRSADSLWHHGLYSLWNSPGQNIGIGSFPLLQGIFPTQGSNPGLPHCWRILYQLSHKGSPAYPFSRGSPRPRNWTRISCTARGFFPNWAIRDPCYLPNTSSSEQSHGVWLPSPSLPSHPYCTCPQINLWKPIYTILLFTEIFCWSPLLTNQILTISRLSRIFFPFK